MQILTRENITNPVLKPYINSIAVRGFADSHPICKKEQKLKDRLSNAIENGDKVAIKKAKQKLAITDFSDCFEQNRRTEIIFTAFLMGGGTYYSDASND